MTAPPVQLGELVETLTRLARTPGSKQLFCGPGVSAALFEALPAASPPTPADAFSGAGIIASLLAVDICPSGDYPPGEFRIVRHYDLTAGRITCAVHGDQVSHLGCAVILEGVLTP